MSRAKKRARERGRGGRKGYPLQFKKLSWSLSCHNHERVLSLLPFVRCIFIPCVFFQCLRVIQKV